MRRGRIVAAAATTAKLGQNPVEMAPQQENAGGDRAGMTMAALMATPEVFMTSDRSFSTGLMGEKPLGFFLF